MKILIVEDDIVIRLMLKRFLEPFGTVDEAATGPDAVTKYKASLEASTHYRLVCLDIQLPGWGGFDVLKEIRTMETAFQISRHKCSRIIMVTSNTEPASIQRACCLSDAYLVKPVSKRVLYDRLLSLGLIRESSMPDILAREVMKICDKDQLTEEELGLLMTSARASLARLERSRVNTLMSMSPSLAASIQELVDRYTLNQGQSDNTDNSSSTQEQSDNFTSTQELVESPVPQRAVAVETPGDRFTFSRNLEARATPSEMPMPAAVVDRGFKRNRSLVPIDD